MQLHADFTQRAVVHAGRADWVPSPVPGVDRRMLDRIGEEVARATSIVRYAPQSRFSPHVHGGGEEFLVLEGTFEDEHGRYPPGTYVRNPPGSRHTPGSASGCTILVKLWQFDPEDRTRVVRDATTLPFHAAAGRPGVETALLHRDPREEVRIERWAPGTTVHHRPLGGIEIFCLEGSFTEGGEQFERWSWLRLPPGRPLLAEAGPEGARLWIKEGHLRFAPRLPPGPA